MKIKYTKEILHFRRFIPSFFNYLPSHKNYLSSWSNTERWFGSMDPNFIKEVTCAPPDIYQHFKLNIDPYGSNFNEHSESNDVFCKSGSISVLKEQIEKFNERGFKFRYLVCAGGDRHLSENKKYLSQIKDRFDKIYYEAKDVECDWIQTIPMGMILAYMLRNGGEEILKIINGEKNKTKLIGTAFGSRWIKVCGKLPDRQNLSKFCSDSNLIESAFCDPKEYYKKLSEFKFFASPIGLGIQTPKICESIMCETVPVVTDHIVHRELRDIYKFPLLIIDEWTDLTEDFLDERWNQVYHKVNWEEQKSKFLVKNFNKLLI